MNAHLGNCRAQCKCPALLASVESVNLEAAREAERRACAEFIKTGLGKFHPGSREWEWSQILARALTERKTQP